MGESLYRLLPAIHRQRDLEVGEPLRALFAVIEGQLDALDADIRGLYDNWFIETCDEWVVPYLADLLAVRGLGDQASMVVSPRARVANTLRHRRRKGTLGALEGLIRDVTGWPAYAVEYGLRVAATQHAAHARAGQGALLDVRGLADPSGLGGAFDDSARTVHVGRIGQGRGRHDLDQIGVFVWRLASHRVVDSPAGVVGAPGDGRYAFDPFGRDTALFARSAAGDAGQAGAAGRAGRAVEAAMPGPLRPGAVAEDLDEYRASWSATSGDATAYYGREKSFALYFDGQLVPPDRVFAGDLAGWLDPAAEPPADRVVVDVTRGRIFAGADVRPISSVRVNYQYGFSGNLGGGTYDRRASLSDPAEEPWRAIVAQGGSTSTLGQALAAWQAAGRPRGAIRIADSGLYREDASVLLEARNQLTIEAADGVRPCLRLDAPMVIAAPSDGDSAYLRLSGLALQGALAVRGAVELALEHCTLVHEDAADPDAVVLASQGASSRVALAIEHSIVGPLALEEGCASIAARDSVLGATRAEGRPAVALAAAGALAGPTSTLERCTVFGRVALWALELASECLFTEPLEVARQQLGCVRYSYVPPGSRTPDRFRCQPDLAVEDALRERDGVALPDDEQALLWVRLRPRFTSERCGEPGFCQLGQESALAIRAGAEDGSEMGVFQHLQQPRRDTNLRLVLAEYLPATLRAGVFRVT